VLEHLACAFGLIKTKKKKENKDLPFNSSPYRYRTKTNKKSEFSNKTTSGKTA